MARGWVWADFENTPHVLFLEPLVRRLRARGWDVRCTAKPQAQTVELAARRGLEAVPLGGGDFSGRARKLAGGLARAASLGRWVARQGRPAALLSCSRSASAAALVLRVPGIGLLDYERAEQLALALASRVIWLPDILRHTPLPWATRRVARFYEGLKENLYLDDWPLDRAAARRALGAADGETVVVARPPASTAHYAAGEGEGLWVAAVRGLAERTGTRIFAVARTPDQRRRLAQVVDDARVRFLETVVDGPEAVSAADLVVGGGGTMNREAAVLGVPVWSVFTGPPPAIDDQLAAEGRLRWVRTPAELAAALAAPLAGLLPPRGPFRGGLKAVAADIEARLDTVERKTS